MDPENCNFKAFYAKEDKCRLTKSACGDMDTCDGQECVLMKMVNMMEVLLNGYVIK